MKVIGVETLEAITLIWAPTLVPAFETPWVDPMVQHEVTRLPAASTRPVVRDTGVSVAPSVKVTVLVACSLQIVTPLRDGLAGSAARVAVAAPVTVVMFGPSAVWASATPVSPNRAADRSRDTVRITAAPPRLIPRWDRQAGRRIPARPCRSAQVRGWHELGQSESGPSGVPWPGSRHR